MSSSRIVSITRCEDFLGVRLERPQGFRFEAGQWLRLGIQTAEGMQTRTLSIASAPDDDLLELGTRRSGSEFKLTLESAQEGQEVEIGGPGGRLRMPEPASSVVFVVGGVGITPVRGMIRDAIHRGIGLEGAILVYGNRHETCVPYASEFDGWKDAGLRIVQVLEEAVEGWRGERGFITSDVLRRAGVRQTDAFIIAGPPMMTEAMGVVLDELGVPTTGRHVEAFGPVAASMTATEERTYREESARG